MIVRRKLFARANYAGLSRGAQGYLKNQRNNIANQIKTLRAGGMAGPKNSSALLNTSKRMANQTERLTRSFDHDMFKNSQYGKNLKAANPKAYDATSKNIMGGHKYTQTTWRSDWNGNNKHLDFKI